jgi:predicted transcriptional regulator
MRKHNGMRPQDVAILLKIVALNREDWQIQPLSNELRISISEISESLNRSRLAGLIDFKKKRVNRDSFLEFLQHGVKYVFPQNPGAMSKGMATAHSHPFMKKHFHSEADYVWPDAQGEIVGQVIEPFYVRQPEAARDDSTFYLILALVDAIRVGRVRESKIAIDELKRILLNEPSR